MTDPDALLSAAAASGAVACDHCDADAELVSYADMPGVSLLNIRHDDWCAVLASHEGRQRTRAQRRAAKKAGYP